ncbi:hypothetical protein CL658_03160 [bacterium]|nr:hypothetical protein [bacterium]|tara:strand:+ start:204 stop:797 length:594 start_codon:yes stop_codon:yes gene_type:complete
MVFISYLPLLFFASIPFKTIIKWLFPIKTPQQSPHIKSGSHIILFGLIHLLNFLVGYAGTTITEQLFFYEYPIFNYIGIAMLTIGYFWSFLKQFNPAGNITSFILGILVFYNIHFLWIFPIIAMVLIIITNHIDMGLFLALLTTYSGIIVLDLNETFIIIHTIIVVLFILRKNNSLTSFFSSNPKTLIDQFYNRHPY